MRPLNVYRIRPDVGATKFRLQNPDEFFLRYPQAFGGGSLLSHYYQLPVPCAVDPSTPTLTHFGHLLPGAIVWSRLADYDGEWGVEEDVLKNECEWIELSIDTGLYHFAINPPVVNALDWKRAEVQRDEDGRIVAITQCAFVYHRLEASIFRLPQGAPWDIFTVLQTRPSLESVANSDLYAAFAVRRLRGLKFELVWSSS